MEYPLESPRCEATATALLDVGFGSIMLREFDPTVRADVGGGLRVLIPSTSDSFSISSSVLKAVIYDLFFPNAGKAVVCALLASRKTVEPISRSCSPFGSGKSHWKRVSRLPSSCKLFSQ